jgi:hypothetical protein
MPISSAPGKKDHMATRHRSWIWILVLLMAAAFLLHRILQSVRP